MKAGLNSAVPVLSVLTALVFCGGRAWTQQNGLSHASDFTSVEYFAAPNQQRMKSRLSGAEAQPQAGGLLVIKKLKLETFDADGKPEMIVNAPECVYDSLKGVANSAGPLKLQNGSGSFRVDGEGFLWRQNDSLLTISNRVHTVVESTTENKVAP